MLGRLSLVLIILAILVIPGFLKEQTRQHIPGTSLLENPGFENGLTAWNNSAGTDPTHITSGHAHGNGGLSWDVDNNGAILSPNAVAVPEGLYGKACLARVVAKYSTGTVGDYTINVDGSVDGNLTTAQDINVNSDYVTYDIGFTCPSSGNFKVEINSTTATTEALLIDDVYLGDDFRIGPTNDNAELIAVIRQPGTALCTGWDEQATDADEANLSRVVQDNDCLSPVFDEGPFGGAVGNLSATGYPRIDFSDLPAGRYLVQVDGIVVQRTGNGHHQALGLTDSLSGITADNVQGTWKQFLTATFTEEHQNASLEGVFNYTTSGARFFEIVSGSTTPTVILNRAVDSENIRWRIYRYPSQSPRDSVTLETQGWFVDAYIDATAGGGSLTTIEASYVGIAQEGYELTVETAKGSADAKIECDGAAPTGLTCSGTEQMGINFDVPYAGVYRGCVSFTGEWNTAAQVRLTFQIVETDVGGTADPLTLSQAGGARQNLFHDPVDNDRLNAVFHLCGNFNFSSAGNKSLAVAYTKNATGAFNFLASGESGNNNIHFTVYPLTQNFPQAVALTGTVSEVFVDTPGAAAAGHGSINTTIRRYTATRVNNGTCITYADSATDGASLTINCDGMYCFSLTDRRAAGGSPSGFSLNSTELTTSIASITAADRVSFAQGESAVYINSTGCRRLSNGDVLRPHTNGAVDCTGATCFANVARVSQE